MRSSILASGTAEMATAVTEPRRETTHSAFREILSTLGQDKFAAVSAAFLILVLLCALFGPALLVLGIEIGAVLRQILHDAVGRLRGDVQRGLAAVIGGVNVDAGIAT